VSATLVIGGARSGKSRYAQRLALSLSATPVYVATSRAWDEEHQRRIERHRRERGPEWQTLECETGLGTLTLEGRVVVVDCITLWLCNLMADSGDDVEACLASARRELEGLLSNDAQLFLVSNEVGQGVVPETRLGTRFRDLQGLVNQHLAEHAAAVVLMVAGIPHYVKGREPKGE
jgi:adenosylcobinamide kinase/adenosylcobinamide-phosphate guanylyltransferase